MDSTLLSHVGNFTKKRHSVLVDNLFVFAMLLVLVGHSDVVDYYRTLWIYKWVYLFHMPLFFSISGYLFALTKSHEMKVEGFVKKKILRLLVPLVVITTLGFLIKTQMGGVAERPVEMTFASYLHCFLYPGDNPVLFLWFLTVLFEIQLILFVFYKLFANNGAKYVKFLILVCFAVYYVIPTINFLYLSQTIYYIAFFVLGILFCRYELKVINNLRLNSIGFMIFSGLCSISLPYFVYSIYLAPVYALVGILFSISLMLTLQKLDIRVCPELRIYTYTIYLLSWFPQSFCRAVLMSFVDFSYWPYISVISFISALLIPYVIGVFANKYLKKGILNHYFRISIGLS